MNDYMILKDINHDIKKHKMWRRECKKVELYKYSILSCYQLKIGCYNYKILDGSFMVATKQKCVLDTQKIERNLSISLEKILNHKGRDKKRNKETTWEPENDKMAFMSL